MVYDADTLVVGGGLAGLACAVALAEKGVKPLVLERSGRLGGRAHSVTDRASGDVIDIGPHLVHSEYRNFPAFLARLGSDGAITWQPEKVITLVTGGRAVEIAHKALPAPFSLMPDFGRTPGLDARDFLSGRAALWRALRFDENDVDALDAVSAYEYLRGKGVSPRMIDVFWRFESMALMNVPLERCSAAALLRVHSWLMRYRDLHFGFPAKGLGELFAAPARRRIEAMGGRVLVDAEVTRIETRDNAHECHVVDGRHFTAPFCVAAVPPQDLARLHSQFAECAAFEPCPYISVYLWLDRKLGTERFWALLWAPERLNYDFYDLTNIRPGWESRPSVIASNIIYSHRAEHLSDEEIIAATLREIGEFAPLAGKAEVRHAAIHRIPMAIVCPTPGVERARPPTRTALERLFLAGDWTRTHLPSSMESAVYSGFRAAEAVLAGMGRHVRMAIAPRAADGLASVLRAV